TGRRRLGESRERDHAAVSRRAPGTRRVPDAAHRSLQLRENGTAAVPRRPLVLHEEHGPAASERLVFARHTRWPRVAGAGPERPVAGRLGRAVRLRAVARREAPGVWTE